jgi:hypothetical protein
VSGLVVLDVDPRHGGDESIRNLKLPPTVEALTGGGGWHEYFMRIRVDLSPVVPTSSGVASI